MSRHPRQYPDRGASLPQKEKDMNFSICVQLLEQDVMGHAEKGVHRYLWHINLQFQVDAFVYLLSELRRNPVGNIADKTWPTVLETFERHPEITIATNSPLYVAVGRLALKSWQARETKYALQGQSPPEGSLPPIISLLQSQRKPISKPKSMDAAINDLQLDPPPFSDSSFDTFNHDFNPTLLDDMGNDMSPTYWEYWDDLIKNSQLPFPQIVPNDQQHGQ
jgi:hypothetical protein